MPVIILINSLPVIGRSRKGFEVRTGVQDQIERRIVECPLEQTVNPTETGGQGGDLFGGGQLEAVRVDKRQDHQLERESARVRCDRDEIRIDVNDALAQPDLLADDVAEQAALLAPEVTQRLPQLLGHGPRDDRRGDDW